MNTTTFRVALGIVFLATITAAQAPVDLATVARIKQEALTRSQVMDHVSWMADVYGPRVTGTPQFQQASEWAVKKFNEWGLANVHLERFAFGQGWKVERFSAHLIEPQTQPIIGYPRTYSPSTKGTVSADVIRVDLRTEADFNRYRGKLKDKIVLPQAARRVRMLEDRLVLRMNDKDIEEASTTPIPADAPGGRGGAGGGPPFADKLAQFYVSEGVVALIERGSDSDMSAGGSDLSWQTQRVDGGTIFPAAAAAAIRKWRHRCHPQRLRSNITTG